VLKETIKAQLGGWLKA